MHTPESLGPRSFGLGLIRPIRRRRRLAFLLSLLSRVANFFRIGFLGLFVRFRCGFPSLECRACQVGTSICPSVCPSVRLSVDVCVAVGLSSFLFFASVRLVIVFVPISSFPDPFPLPVCFPSSSLASYHSPPTRYDHGAIRPFRGRRGLADRLSWLRRLAIFGDLLSDLIPGSSNGRSIWHPLCIKSSDCFLVVFVFVYSCRFCAVLFSFVLSVLAFVRFRRVRCDCPLSVVLLLLLLPLLSDLPKFSINPARRPKVSLPFEPGSFTAGFLQQGVNICR